MGCPGDTTGSNFVDDGAVRKDRIGPEKDQGHAFEGCPHVDVPEDPNVQPELPEIPGKVPALPPRPALQHMDGARVPGRGEYAEEVHQGLATANAEEGLVRWEPTDCGMDHRRELAGGPPFPARKVRAEPLDPLPRGGVIGGEARKVPSQVLERPHGRLRPSNLEGDALELLPPSVERKATQFRCHPTEGSDEPGQESARTRRAVPGNPGQEVSRILFPPPHLR